MLRRTFKFLQRASLPLFPIILILGIASRYYDLYVSFHVGSIFTLGVTDGYFYAHARRVWLFRATSPGIHVTRLRPQHGPPEFNADPPMKLSLPFPWIYYARDGLWGYEICGHTMTNIDAQVAISAGYPLTVLGLLSLSLLIRRPHSSPRAFPVLAPST
jgi:hypothetical protein